MAEFRKIQTKIWEDELFEKFDSTEKLFWLFLLTNPDTKSIGVYKISDRKMEYYTGLDRVQCKNLIARFQSHKLVHFSQETSEIALLKWGKYNLSRGGKPILDLIKKEISEVKDINLLMLVYQHFTSDVSPEIAAIFKRFLDNHVSWHDTLDDTLDDTPTIRATFRRQDIDIDIEVDREIEIDRDIDFPAKNAEMNKKKVDFVVKNEKQSTTNNFAAQVNINSKQDNSNIIKQLATITDEIRVQNGFEKIEWNISSAKKEFAALKRLAAFFAEKDVNGDGIDVLFRQFLEIAAGDKFWGKQLIPSTLFNNLNKILDARNAKNKSNGRDTNSPHQRAAKNLFG